MLILMQGSIFNEGPVSISPSVGALRNLLLCASQHGVYVLWTNIVIVYEILSHPSIMMFLAWIQIRPCIRSLKHYAPILLNNLLVCNKRVGEWSNRFRVTPKRRRPTEDQSMRDHLLIMCEILADISAVNHITCGDWRYQIISQYITERLSI